MLDEDLAIIDILNKVLKIEYTFIWVYPRIAELITDKKTAELFIKLGEDSAQHADKTVYMVRCLHGNPLPNLLETMREPPQESSLITVLKDMLEKEKAAAQLYREAAELTNKPVYKGLLLGEVKEEERHAKVVEAILARLTQQGHSQSE